MKILNYGSCNVDYVYLLDHIVNVGETESSQSLSVFCGGKGLNQSIAIARAGQNVYHAGCIGKNGEFLSKILAENGVNVDFLKSVDSENGHAIIQLSKSGENSIFLYDGSNAKITIEHVEEYEKAPYWAKVIWDVTAVAWLLNDNDAFMKSRLVTTPLPSYDGHYTQIPDNHLMSYVYYIKRNELMTDLITKLTTK